MATQGSTPEISLRINKTFSQSRERVYQAWTDPQALSQWFAPSDEFTVVVGALDVRPGGTFRVEMRHKDGNVHAASGKYLEVQKPSKLVFTWAWDMPDAEQTVITIDFREQGASTELIMVQDKFATAESRDKHEQGWAGCLSRLEKVLVYLATRRWKSRIKRHSGTQIVTYKIYGG